MEPLHPAGARGAAARAPADEKTIVTAEDFGSYCQVTHGPAHAGPPLMKCRLKGGLF